MSSPFSDEGLFRVFTGRDKTVTGHRQPEGSSGGVVKRTGSGYHTGERVPEELWGLPWEYEQDTSRTTISAY